MRSRKWEKVGKVLLIAGLMWSSSGCGRSEVPDIDFTTGPRPDADTLDEPVSDVGGMVSPRRAE